MVGYKVSAGSETLYLRLLGSNPYMSAKDNYSTSAVLTEDKLIGQGEYNWLYYEPPQDGVSRPFNGGTLRVKLLLKSSFMPWAVANKID